MTQPTDNIALQSLLRDVLSDLRLDLNDRQIGQLAVHFSLLLHWNRKINLTSLRRPEEIAKRHFGESLFLATLLSSSCVLDLASPPPEALLSLPRDEPIRSNGLLVDVGSGAGFPGLPLKIAWPSLRAVLLEPNNKKQAFLKEVVRRCGIEGVEIRAERLEEAARGDLRGPHVPACRDRVGWNLVGRASLVTVRAVAIAQDMVDDLKKLLTPGGQLALFLGAKDASALTKTPDLYWDSLISIPHSERRVILIGRVGGGS